MSGKTASATAAAIAAERAELPVDGHGEDAADAAERAKTAAEMAHDQSAEMTRLRDENASLKAAAALPAAPAPKVAEDPEAVLLTLACGHRTYAPNKVATEIFCEADRLTVPVVSAIYTKREG